MDTKFLKMSDFMKLRNKILKGDEESIDFLFEELSRLESIIKDYEIGLKSAVDKYETTIFKNVSKIPD